MKLFLKTEPYNPNHYPSTGKHILAQTTDDLIVVYQAYKESIATHAVKNQKLSGPDYSLNRMSWIKPNFLWMMYRSGWASKEGQERVLAFWITKEFFDRILEESVSSSFDSDYYKHVDEWRKELNDKEVILQWDPDHDPHGKPVERRAIQLGLKGAILKEFATVATVQIEDITPFVADQFAKVRQNIDGLTVPTERSYTPASSHTINKIGLDAVI
jgi:hypothetical protein